MSKSRAWAVVTILVVALLVALGLGLGLSYGLKEKEPETVEKIVEKVVFVERDPPTSARLTAESPVYVEPSYVKEGAYKYLAVATDSEPCSKIGTDIMVRQKGSAVDAAIASLLCAGIYHPQSCGVGGGFFMTFYKRSEKKAYSIMARDMAPGAAFEEMFVPGNVSSSEGGMSIAIPGEVKGLYEAWRLGGSLPWKDLFAPAIKMCREGFKIGDLLDHDIQHNLDAIDRHVNLKQMLTSPSTQELYKKGETIRLPRLAETLEKIADDPHTFYNGSLAQDIADDIKDQGGIITTDDLKAYTAAVKTPVAVDIKGGYTVYSPPPPSSGAVVQLILNILNGFNFDKDNMGELNATVETFHKVVEAFKHGFAVRTNLGDGDMENQAFKDNIEELLRNMTSPAFGAALRARITDRAHDTDYYSPTYSHGGSDSGTSHLSVLGPNGDAVSVTSTVNLYFGSKVVGSKTGIIFNDQMDDFSTPGTVNYFGIPASPANFIKPFKRPLSSMSPSVVVDADGEVKLVTGASGGSRIVTATAWSIIQTLWLELGMKEAIDYPRLHHQLLPATVRVDKRMPQAILDGLSAKGHEFEIADNGGSAVQAILQRSRDEVYASCDLTKFGVADGA